MIFGYDHFVIPFVLAVIFLILYLSVGLIKIILKLKPKERKMLLKSLFSVQLLKSFRDIFADALLHVKIFRRNILLGYMHFSIAFGWFMLILIGHIEVMLYTPHRNGLIYYPVFFRFFVMKTNDTLSGALLFFIMDFFLLVVLSGVGLAIYKRFRSVKLGMKRTTRLNPGDKIALWSLWLVFPLRLLAESFTAEISGGSFLTSGVNSLFGVFINNLDYMLPVWWAYSITLSIFIFALPFSRYMHIPTEILLIFLRNAGIKSSSSTGGYANSEIYSCSSCGICIDACPMSIIDNRAEFTTVYLIRKLRNRDISAIESSEYCLMCGKCVEMCPVKIDSCYLKQHNKRELFNSSLLSYNYLNTKSDTALISDKNDRVAYYAGCMTHLTPVIYHSLFNILKRAGIEYTFIDSEGSVCCGRPLVLSGGGDRAEELIRYNTELIKSSNAGILLLSCPICYKFFKENYSLGDIEIMHHTTYLHKLISEKRLMLKKAEITAVYHDPCELGRGRGVYDQPRLVLSGAISALNESPQCREESICCGGSLASRSLTYSDRDQITRESLSMLKRSNPDLLITACPLCLKTFSSINTGETMDIAQIVEKQMV